MRWWRRGKGFVPIQERFQGRGCLVTVLVAIIVVSTTLCGGCINFFLRGVGLKSEPDIQGVMGMSARLKPRSEFHINLDGAVVSGLSYGQGFSITWTTPETTGARAEEVLDATLRHLQAIQKSPRGSDTLARHIFKLDQLLDEIRRSGFSESTLSSAGGPGFKAEASPSAEDRETDLPPSDLLLDD